MRKALAAYRDFVGAKRIEWMPTSAREGRLFGTCEQHKRSKSQ